MNRLILKQFKRNFPRFQMQTIERFVRGCDAAFCQITLTTCLKVLLPEKGWQALL